MISAMRIPAADFTGAPRSFGLSYLDILLACPSHYLYPHGLIRP